MRDPASLEDVAAGYRLAQVVYALAALGVPDELGDEARMPEEIAAAIGAHPPSLARLLRAAAGQEILEHDGGRYALTPFTARLRRDAPDSARAMVLGWRCLPAKYDAFGGLTDTVRTGRPAFEQTHGARFYEHLATRPDEAAAYDAAMDSTLSGFVDAVDAVDLGAAHTLVDVGGGHGGLLIAALQRHPHLRGVLFDLPAVVAEAQPLLERAGVADRAEVVGGDMFESVPAGADVYMFSTVLRCFGDEDCARILRATRAAMSDGAALHAYEMVHPDGPWHSPAGLADLDAMVLYGGRDRTATEWEALVARAGLRLESVTPCVEPYSLVTARC